MLEVTSSTRAVVRYSSFGLSFPDGNILVGPAKNKTLFLFTTTSGMGEGPRQDQEYIVFRTQSGSAGMANISSSARPPVARNTATSSAMPASPSPWSTPTTRIATWKSAAPSNASIPTRTTPSSTAWPKSTWIRMSTPGTSPAMSAWCRGPPRAHHPDGVTRGGGLPSMLPRRVVPCSGVCWWKTPCGAAAGAGGCGRSPGWRAAA